MKRLFVMCCKTISINTKKKHAVSSLCKIRRNINRYSELVGGYRIMDEKHIANGDVDSDGVIQVESHKKAI